MKYHVSILKQAMKDLADLTDVITYQYHAPLTSFRYMRGLRAVIYSLESSAESYTVQTNSSLVEKYGHNVRRINYKKMAIIYTVHGDTVYVHRIIPASMV